MTLRIAHITSAHPVTDMRVFRKMAQSQADRGWEVHGIALDLDSHEPKYEIRAGVKLHLLAGRGLRHRALRASIGAARVAWKALSLRPDIVQGHDPELIPFLLLMRLFRIRTIYDAHEDLIAQNRHKQWAKGVKWWLIQAYAYALVWLARVGCWRLMAATDGVAQAYPSNKTLVVRNFPIAGELGRLDPSSRLLRPRRLVYLGGISEKRGIVELVAAVERCPALEGLDLVGRFETDALEAKVRAMHGWRKVSFHGYLGRKGLVEVLSQVRGGLVVLHATPNHLHSIPVKMMEYFSVGLPIIASNFPYWHELALADQTALMVDPLDIDQIASAMGQLLSDERFAAMSDAVIEGPRKSYVWQAEANRMNDWLLAQLGRKASDV